MHQTLNMPCSSAVARILTLCVFQVKARSCEVLTSVLKQLGVSDLQVFGLAVVRGQSACVCVCVGDQEKIFTLNLLRNAET